MKVASDLLMNINMPRIEKILHYRITWKHIMGMLFVLFVVVLILVGLEPWYFASCRKGLTPAVKLFLLVGMDPNLSTEPGFCCTIHPLAYAIESGNPATCETLIAAGANIRDVAFHYGPIAYAAQVGNVPMVNYFISRENIGDSPAALAQTIRVILMRGATYGKVESVDYAIENGADPNFPMPPFGNLARAAISEARQSGNAELMEKLQQKNSFHMFF